MSIASPARKCLKLDYCINAHETPGDLRGPNIIIELNYWHAQQLAGFLQEFQACAIKVKHPLYGNEINSIEDRGSKSEQAMCELYFVLKSCLDSNAN